MRRGYRSHFVMAGWLAFALRCGPVPAVAPGVVISPLTPGWDGFPVLQQGSVTWRLTPARVLEVTFAVTGAEPGEGYDLVFVVFGAPGGGVKRFGVEPFHSGNYTREGRSADGEAFRFGMLRTDGRGNGRIHATLDLSGVPPGTYHLQFGLARQDGSAAVVYRTGRVFAEGGETIILTKRVIRA